MTPQTELQTAPVTEQDKPRKADPQSFRRRLIERQRNKQETLGTFFLGRRDHYRTVDKDSRTKHLEDMDMTCRYLNGDQYSEYNENGVLVDQRRDWDYAYSIPVINGHAEQVLMQLLKTKPGYVFSANNQSDPSIVAVSKMAEELAVEEKDRLMTEDAQMDEILNTVCAGESARCLLWGINPESPKTAQRIDYKSEVIELPGSRKCQACDVDVPDGEKACPKCGATYIKSAPGAKATKLVPEEVEVPLSENILHIPHMMAVQRSLSAQKPKHSTFVVERDYLPKNVAEWMYQTIIEDEENLTGEVLMRQQQERYSQQTDPIVGSSRTYGGNSQRDENSNPVQREHIYMDAVEYGHKWNKEEETLPADPDIYPNGLKVPAGKLLGEVFPDGLYLCYVGRTLVRAAPLNKNRRWSWVFYGKRPGSSRGAGLQPLITLQDIINDDFNQKYAIKMTSARPLTILNRQAVKELPMAGQFLSVDKLPSTVNGLDWAVKQLPGQAAAEDGTSAWIEGMMQFIGGTYSLQGHVGAPDAKVAGTATGAAMMNENANGRMIGPIMQRIAADKELMLQILENIRDYSAPEQRKELAKRFGPDVVESFFNCNFRQTLSISVKENTDTPRSMALTQANIMAFGQIASGLKDVPWGLELLSTMGDVLGIPFEIGPGRSDRREAEYRLNKLAAIEARALAKNPSFLADTAAAATRMYEVMAEICAPLVDPFMHEHESFKDVYKDWLFGERAKTSSDAMKAVVGKLWFDHFEAQQAQQFKLAELTKKLSGEVNPQPDEDDQAETAVAGAALEHITEQDSRDADMQREEAQKDEDLKRRLVEKAAEHELAQQAQQNGNQPEIVR